MQVTLNDIECNAVLDALNYYLPNLREEIGKTENYDMRQRLHEQEAALTALIVKLGGSVENTNTPDITAKNPPWGK